MQNICLALAKNQEAQQKCFDELENVNFTSDRFEDTPYFWATVKEGLRYMPSIYRSLVHTVTVVSKSFTAKVFKIGQFFGRKMAIYFLAG